MNFFRRTDSGLPANLAGRHNIFILFLFLASGVSGLIYEVVWTRQLTYIFGASIFSVSTVIAAFMGGLAIGSWLGGSYADHHRNPLKLYAFLELGIGLTAALFPLAIRAVEPLYILITHYFQASFITLSLIRFAVNFVLLVVPTSLMGATLPTLSRFIARKADEIGPGSGLLYGFNAFGSVLGCFWTGFYGIRLMGIDGATSVAIAINFAVGITALWMSRGVGNVIADEDPARDSSVYSEAGRSAAHYPPRIVALFLAGYGLSGFSAMGYQIIWTRSLIFSFDQPNTTYTFAAMLSVFIAGLAIGSALMSLLERKIRDPLKTFSFIQLFIGLSAVLSLYIIVFVTPDFYLMDYVKNDAGEFLWMANEINIIFNTGLAIFLPTMLMGMSFPLAIRVCSGSVNRTGFSVGRVYTVNTVGAILGAFLSGFIFIPALGCTNLLLALSALNIFIGLLLAAINPMDRHGSLRRSLAVSSVSFMVIIVTFGQNVTPRPHFEREEWGQGKLIFHKEGPLDTISVAEFAQGPQQVYRMIAVDGNFVAGTNPFMLTDQKTLAHLPMLLLDRPASALAFGFGSGGTAWSFLQYRELRRLDVVEISPTILEAAPYLENSNHGVLRQPRDARLNIIVDDARNYLRTTSVLYDIIEIDCTDLFYKSNAGLYNKEFFELSKKRLSPDGAVTVWVPLVKLSDASFRSILLTFHKVFPNVSIWYFSNYPTHFILMLGKTSPLQIDLEKMLGRLDDGLVSTDLAEINLADPMKILSSFVTDQEYLLPVLEKGGLLNTENNPYVEFDVPRFGDFFGNQQLVKNLELLMNGHRSIYPYLSDLPENKADELKSRMERYYKALPHLIKGHIMSFDRRGQEAFSSYKVAEDINPQDLSVRQLRLSLEHALMQSN